MNQCCNDIFRSLNLPFETYFVECVNHDCCEHEDLEIIWVLKGQAKIRMKDKCYALHAQDVFLVFMNTKHSVEVDPGSITISLRLKHEHLEARGLYFNKIPFREKVFSFNYLAHKYEQVPLILMQMLKILLSGERKETVYYKLIAFYNFYIFELYNMLIKDYTLDVKTIDFKKYHHRSHMIVEYIHQHYKERITLDDLAALTGLSTYRVAHFIKESLGITMKELIANVRVEKAINLFKTTDLPTQTISKQVGFSDYKYFTQAIKKRYKLTPLQCRKRIQTIDTKIQFDPNQVPFIEEIKECLNHLEQTNKMNHVFMLNT